MPLVDMAREEVDRIIKEIPPQKKGQLTTALTMTGVRAEAAWFVTPNWALVAYGERTWKGANVAGVFFKGSF